VDDRRKDEQPKLERLIAEMRAREAPTRLWLERNLAWIVGVMCFVMGLMVGRLW
jgi:hypothetical protein